MKSDFRTLQQLRDAGFKVYVNHHRRTQYGESIWEDTIRGIREAEKAGLPILPTGGKTIVTIKDGAGDFVTAGVAECSDRDPYNKTIGLQIALGRALKGHENLVKS